VPSGESCSFVGDDPEIICFRTLDRKAGEAGDGVVKWNGRWQCDPNKRTSHGNVLAECKTEALAIKTLVDYAIGQYVNGNNDPMTASMAKLFAAEKCDQIVDKCLQIFGGYGYMAEYPIANMYTGSRVNRIYGGTSEIMKEIISRSL